MRLINSSVKVKLHGLSHFTKAEIRGLALCALIAACCLLTRNLNILMFQIIDSFLEPHINPYQTKTVSHKKYFKNAHILNKHPCTSNHYVRDALD